MHLGDAFGHHEPADRFLDRTTDGEQAVVAQDAELVVAERRRNALAAVVGQHLDLLVVEQCLVEHEGTRLLAERSERLDVRRPRRTELRVRVRGAHGVWPSSEHGSVDVVAGGVDGAGRVAVGVGHPAVGADEHQLVDGRPVERDAPIEQPEVVGQDRITRRDVAVAELSPPHRAEDPVAERTHPLAMHPFCLGRAHGVERLDAREGRIRRLAHPPSVNPSPPTTFALHSG